MDRVLMFPIAIGSTIRSLSEFSIPTNYGEKLKVSIIVSPCLNVKSFSIKEVTYMMDYLKNSIVAFDLRTENLRVIELGNDICDNKFDYDLIEVKGKIGYFTGRNDLWILEYSKKEEWNSHGIHIPSQ
ncbi:hypothetical protein H5410_026192 [Solanum commersonii]|uniref:F-box associated beta-propeller type 3 domain-containing protein n=1 Tax=Solanum commersonii TaxID=4109 RepID=A0A9J5Z035_SOLCO|nr:hypothetical protein H5410_026192 [Solanum commersonii]